MKKNLTILGSKKSSDEVVELLQMFGGKLVETNEGEDGGQVFHLDADGHIVRGYPSGDYVSYTLGNFKEKYPYKVGDKVIHQNCMRFVRGLEWNGTEVRYRISYGDNYLLSEVKVEHLKPYKEKKEDKKVTCKLDWPPTPKGFKLVPQVGYEIKQDGDEFYLVKKESKYPDTYEECCKVMGIEYPYIDTSKGTPFSATCYRADLVANLIKLLICRDAYWKIAGDWKPENRICGLTINYMIITSYDEVFETHGCSTNAILSFPTEELRGLFYKNFKDLIISVKELL